MLDMFQQEQADAAATRPEEATRLPVGFGEAFDAAWSNARLFQQSVAGHNARMAALDDYVADVEKKTGRSLTSEIAKVDPEMVDPWRVANAVVREWKGKDPTLDISPVDPDQIEARAVDKSRQAQSDYAGVTGRERTFGGSLGMALGGMAGQATDPINLLALPIAPAEGLGLLATALRWGMIGGGAQAAIELAGLPYREEVQPGYIASGEPITNVAEAAGGAALLGGGVKALGNVWTRVKTGAWPQSVRDAGNLAEHEANILQTNRLGGAEGEMAHRNALSKAIDDLTAGRSVDVDGMMPPGAWQDARRLVVRLEGERNKSLPQFDERIVRLMSEEAGLRERDSLLQTQLGSVGEGNPTAAETLARLQAIEAQAAEAGTAAERKALMRRRDELLTDTTHERLRGDAAPLELRRQIESERASIADRMAAATAEREDLQKGSVYTSPAGIGERPGRLESMLDMRRAALNATEAAKAELAAGRTTAAPELPFTATAKQAQAEQIASSASAWLRAVTTAAVR